MGTTNDVLSRVRQPEYTGENRCIPCTITNAVIAAVLVGALALVSPPVALGFGVIAAGSIWLRGYLVPKTPELTKRYFPEWLLAKFDKAPEPVPDPPSDFEPEEALLEAGVIEPCAEVDDLCLTDGFETAWWSRIDALEGEGTLREELAAQLDLDPETVTFETYGDAFLAHSDGTQVGQWESRAALLADLAAAKEFPDWVDYWSALSPQHRSQLLGGLRVFVTTCPNCGGAVTADTEVVESCCRSTTVVAVECEDCEDRLLEVPHQEPA
jgi:hypothetical protein